MRLYGIQIVRALSCLMIVIAHHVYLLEVAYGVVPALTFNYVGRGGMLGCTSLFLAITGYFATKAITKPSNANIIIAPARFALKRYGRLLPT